MNASIRIPHSGYRISTEEALSLLQLDEEALLTWSADLRDYGPVRNLSYSRKVFIPLNQLGSDVCKYSTFDNATKWINKT